MTFRSSKGSILEHVEVDDNFGVLQKTAGLISGIDPYLRTLVYQIKAVDFLRNTWISSESSPLFTPFWVAQGQAPEYGIIQVMLPTMQIRGENGAVFPETEVINGDHNIRVLEDISYFKKTDFDTGGEIIEGESYFWDGGAAPNTQNSTKFSVNQTLTKDILLSDEGVMLNYKRSAVNTAANFGEYQMFGTNYKSATNANGSSTIFQTQVDVRRNQWHLIFEFFTQSSNPIADAMDENTAGEILIFVTYKEFQVI